MQTCPEQDLPIPSPVDNGWMQDESGNLIPKFVNRTPAPESLVELVLNGGCEFQCINMATQCLGDKDDY